jgi:prolyl 4-hydroxylase
MQVVHYKPDGHYHLHNDWFDPKNPGYAERIKDRGQRIVSIFVYLSDCEVCARSVPSLPPSPRATWV